MAEADSRPVSYRDERSCRMTGSLAAMWSAVAMGSSAAGRPSRFTSTLLVHPSRAPRAEAKSSRATYVSSSSAAWYGGAAHQPPDEDHRRPGLGIVGRTGEADATRA